MRDLKDTMRRFGSFAMMSANVAALEPAPAVILSRADGEESQPTPELRSLAPLRMTASLPDLDNEHVDYWAGRFTTERDMPHDLLYLAAAAYNSGENRVARVMREVTGSERGSEEDFYAISARLPEETRDYVPRLIAAARIANAPEKYGFAEGQS